MEHTNGDANGNSSSPVVVAPVDSASTHNAASTLDPSDIGRRVEQEVNALLEASHAEADRIRAKAIAGIRMAEAKVAAMQQQMATTLAQLSELAERIEPGRPAERRSLAERQLAKELNDRPSLAERFAANGSKPAQSAPSVFDPPKEERPAPGIPPSEEIVRILREHLT